MDKKEVTPNQFLAIACQTAQLRDQLKQLCGFVDDSHPAVELLDSAHAALHESVRLLIVTYLGSYDPN